MRESATNDVGLLFGLVLLASLLVFIPKLLVIDWLATWFVDEALIRC